MGKIRVTDLAKKMGVPAQDLLFKLRSIGVRVEDDQIDTEFIQAILQGKQLPQAPQREVILRDAQSGPGPAPAAAAKRRRPAPPPRRPAPASARPPRRRTVVQKTDRIKTLPATRRSRSPTPEEVAAQEIAAEEAAQTPAATAISPQPVEAPTAKPVDTVPPLPAPAAKRSAPATTAPEPGADRKTRRAHRRVAEAAPASEGAAAARETVTISEGMRVRDLADKLDIKTKDLLKSLFARGVMTTVNQVLEPELAQELAREHGFDAMIVSFEEEVQLQHETSGRKTSTGTEPRAPVVTVMGHVDHGKTSLLDAIRSSAVTEEEFGGITQHIAAYQVDLEGGKKVVLLDTPGHEAFTQLRARGAQVTDIVVLVVAADDGVMPQTVEAIQHARAAGVPIVVAINKMDKAGANPDRVKKELSEQELLVEDWGGEVVAVPVSAIKKEGLGQLLEMIQLTADILELKADPSLPAQGTVIEARKEHGRGIIATVLVQNGTLEVGHPFVTGATWGRVRSMSDDRGRRVPAAGPSTPVEVSGFDELPAAGDLLQVVEKESQARDIAAHRREEQRLRELAPSAGRLSLEGLFSSIKEGEIKELPVVIKADVQGSVEVLKETLHKLSTDKVKVRVIGAGAGAISTNDVALASASDAIIYGFNVRPERNASELAEKEGVDIRTHTVIYELTDELKKAMTGLLEPTYREVERGRAEVRQVFKVPKIGVIAGCHVVEGVIPRSAQVRLLRDNVVIHEGRIGSLRRFKEDAAEVRSGFDCGIGLERFQDLKPGDLIEAYAKEAVAATL
ncbi:MAG TPA: translation initiation factor IF-2 [Thermoanaerobaculia bacterium]|nr:translation initiation factor IF-2 [Thermoanaerobaculia bacterium]